MFWKYLLVFICAFLVDVVPVPIPPAFTVMILFQVIYHLNIWIVIALGVAGSILGRTVLTIYISKLSPRIFSRAKNEDVQYLGSQLREKGWRGQAFILAYSLMPLPTTPLFIAAGMASLSPVNIIPAFTVGKVLSDATAVLLGHYAAKNVGNISEGLTSWQSISGFVLGLLMVLALIFIDWRTLLQKKKLVLKFKVWKKRARQ